MKWKILHIIIAVSLMVAGCTDSADEHSDNEKSRQEHELRLTMGMPQLQNATRAAGDLPDGFTEYNYSEAKAPIDQIVGFFVPQESGSSTSYYTCHFIYEEGSHVWRTKAYLADGNYYFYGYMPNVSASSVTVEPIIGNEVQTGATITLSGLNAAMPDDISVIEGVQPYSGSTLPDMSDAIGRFDYNASDNPVDNFYVLASHIYAGLEINMKLDATYANLRTIKLRSISLTPYVNDSEVAKKINATITITHRGGNVLTEAVSVAFTTSETAASSAPAVLYGVENTSLTTTDQEFLAYLCPNLSPTTKYVMETHYDVYDKKDNLIRENQTATNNLSLSDLTLEQGKKYTITITVAPTYLYVLSDPDLDNPTFTLQ